MGYKKKRMQQAVNKKPKWVGDVDVSECEFGKVYNIYECRTCHIEMGEDKARKKRTRVVYIKTRRKKPKKTLVDICECAEPTTLLIKYKKCVCKAEYWGFYLRESTSCKLCGLYSLEPGVKKRQYFRLNEFLIHTIEDLSDPDRWDCINRNLCLECTYDDGSKKGIACKECPHYDNGR